MSAVPQPSRFPDAEAYLAWEERQTERHEYVDGQIYAMVGVRAAHNTISMNALFFLRRALKGAPCRVHGIEFKLNLGAQGDFVYPDAMVTCDPRDRLPGEDRFISHPWLIAEVLSENTAAYDRGRKFELYREIDTLTHYLLIEQDRVHVDLFFRNEKSQWILQPLAAPDSIVIERLGQPWPVSTLYEDVDFTPPPAAAAAT